MDCPHLYLPGNNCTGCSVCANICPVDAIEMASRESDDCINRGFKYPRIDGALCTSCGRCVDCCPVLNPVPSKAGEKTAYSVRCDPYRKNCSSGGVFGALATCFVKDGGKAVGAGLLPSLDVREVMVDSEEGVLSVCKSKYVQSDAGNIYVEVRKALEDGSKVLFCSTPCQVAGIRSFLGREYENLYTIDLICHGVSSSDLLRRIMDEGYPDSNVVSVDFRSKYRGWGPITMAIRFDDGTTRYASSSVDTFFNCFLKNTTLRPSCYSCPYSNMSRYGDLTIGDDWGINPKDNDHKGTSAVIVNSRKGLELMEMLRECGAVINETTIDSLYNRHRNLKSPSPKAKTYDEFHRYAEDHSIRESTICAHNHHDVGIAVMTSKNYGNNLTNWSLYNAVRKLGYSAVMIPRDRGKVSSVFGKSPFTSSDLFRGTRNIAGKMADVFIVGSDQVFASHNIAKDDMFSLLPWVGSDRYMFSYSSSFGQDVFDVDDGIRSMVGFYLKRFDALSLRELSGPGLVQSLFNISAVHMPDPVFLTPKEDYVGLADMSDAELPDVPFIGVYMLVVSETSIRQVRDVASRMGIDRIVYIGNSGKASINADGFVPMQDPTVEDFLKLIDRCAVFLTDSFHGSCFSVILNKQFYLLKGSETRSPDRIDSLLETFNLPDLRLSHINDLVDIDYSAVQSVVDGEMARGTEWLKSQIEKGMNSRKVSDQYDLLVSKMASLEKTAECQNRLFRSILLGRNEESFGYYLESESAQGLIDTARSLLSGQPCPSDFEKAAMCYAKAIQKDEESIRYAVNALGRVSDRGFRFRIHRILSMYADSADPEVRRLVGIAKSRDSQINAKD